MRPIARRGRAYVRQTTTSVASDGKKSATLRHLRRSRSSRFRV
jgi:hypothetical protein